MADFSFLSLFILLFTSWFFSGVESIYPLVQCPPPNPLKIALLSDLYISEP